jgi:hypothetical protein
MRRRRLRVQPCEHSTDHFIKPLESSRKPVHENLRCTKQKAAICTRGTIKQAPKRCFKNDSLRLDVEQALKRDPLLHRPGFVTWRPAMLSRLRFDTRYAGLVVLTATEPASQALQEPTFGAGCYQCRLEFTITRQRLLPKCLVFEFPVF